jgi:hypothetical protein
MGRVARVGCALAHNVARKRATYSYKTGGIISRGQAYG